MEQRHYDNTPSPLACRLLSCTPALGVHTKTAPRLTVDEQLELVGFGRMQALALFAFMLIIMSDGMELVVTNIIWPQLPAQAWGLVSGSGSRAMLVSLAFFGFVLGTVISAVLGDLVGRRPLIFIHSGVFIPMSLFSAAAGSLEQLAFTRFFVGVSMGIVFPCVCSMMAEYTPHKWRARCIMAMPGVGYRSMLISHVFLRARERFAASSKHET
jgi:MFS family permease